MKGYKIHKWTKADEKILIDNFQTHTCKEIAAIIGCTEAAVKRRRKDLGVLKTEEALTKIYARPNAGQYSRGSLPVNTLHDDAITIRTDKRGTQYKWIRISLGKWQQLHIYNWLKAGNIIPEGHVVAFKTPDTLNCDVDNLECISRSQNLIQNRLAYLKLTGERKEARASAKQKNRLDRKQRKEQKQLQKEQERLSKIAGREQCRLERKATVADKPTLRKVSVAKIQSEAKRRREEEKKLRIQRIVERQNIEAERHAKRKAERTPLHKTRNIDYSGMQHVKINTKTWVVVKPGTDVNTLMKAYKEKSLL